MLVLDIPANGLLNVRFGWSMLGEVTRSLWAAGRADQPRWIGSWWSEVKHQLPPGGLPLLQELIPLSGDAYIPEFMLPTPLAAPSLDDELHTLATTPSELVRAEMMAVVAGEPDKGVAALPRPLAARLMDQRGEEGYVSALADQMHAYWNVAIGPYWPKLLSGLQRDVERRGRMLGSAGLGRTLTELSPRVLCRDGKLFLRVSLNDRRTASDGLWCDASVFLYDRVIQGRKPDGLEQISYAASGGAAVWESGGRSACSSALAELIGRVRASLLADLEEPETTVALAVRHQIAASTVSYHLSALRRAGLLDRSREGKQVMYRQSELGAALCRGPEHPSS